MPAGWLPSGASWGPGILVVLASAGLAGLFHLIANRGNGRPPQHFLGLRATAWNVALHTSMLAMVVWRLEADGHNAFAVIGGFWIAGRNASISMPAAIAALAACCVIAVTWTRLPVVKRLASAGDPGAYSPGGRLTVGALLVLVFVRYPLTVLAEETVFRGLLQLYLGWGVVVASVAFAAYHVMQWRTIPSLLPYAFAYGILAAWTGSLLVGGVVHYALDAGFALVIVLPQQRRRERKLSAGPAAASR